MQNEKCENCAVAVTSSLNLPFILRERDVNNPDFKDNRRIIYYRHCHDCGHKIEDK